MLKKIITKSIAVLFSLCILTSGVCADDMAVWTPTSSQAITSTLERGVRSVSENDINSWAASVLSENELADMTAPCTWQNFFVWLWKLNGAEEVADTSLFMDSDPDYYIEREHAIAWAVQKGLSMSTYVRQQCLYTMRHGDAQWCLWFLSGSPAPLAKQHKLPIGTHDAQELWACDIGLITQEEQPNSNPTKQMTLQEGISYLYYYYNRRSENSFPITVDEFLAACQAVCDTARAGNYRYGSSSAANPTTDGIISCDRMIAKALYDLGYTNQPAGGITCGNADQYLSSWGFERSTSLSDARRGSIMLVMHNGENSTTHMFVFASDFNFQSMTGDRYDCGSKAYIDRQQPLQGLGFWYRTDNLIVYNIPE